MPESTIFQSRQKKASIVNKVQIFLESDWDVINNTLKPYLD